MGALVVVEGLDGSGKRTLTAALTAALEARGATVASLAFPRYGASVEADLLTEALHGRAGDLGASVHGMAALFALDRGGARAWLGGALGGHDVVLLDRYAASNAAFGAARLHQHADGAFVEWVRELEFGRLGLPVPALQLLLRVPVALAQQRAAGREAEDTARARDAFERDGGLQERTGAVYDELAAAAWVSPWRVLEGTVDVDTVAGALLG
ncbi:dTMP kinase [Rhodococcus antarcticus]|uniref:Thymidylate kinase n=1 Tax=Rhodococcus antarcticus TaxID=2987751 RepID=A0ABY6P2P9_9NOCA|nr:dTMP kinase [Rhodococcus antarcticus]UZJ25556.1 dTMP kinase [Rhodococcus antarcticus]